MILDPKKKCDKKNHAYSILPFSLWSKNPPHLSAQQSQRTPKHAKNMQSINKETVDSNPLHLPNAHLPNAHLVRA